ncbi:hypothetical protein [Paraliomyxa miuraensis]|uniref:hypothetical protein n=1 Tax=Paraliomyxa miuraensis TaxID=376150 RepID=UPI00224EAA4D|nr:hypothetical protein [Paraliomyxa miuraensis]MCX4240211.1 hypothetical protein [Paraliomyxa miuraensis]
MLSVVLLLGCVAEEEELATARRDYENVGARIPHDVANRWLARHDQSNTQSHDEPVPYATAAELTEVLTAVPERFGVVFHHALDDAGAHHLLVTAVDDDIGLWESPILDATGHRILEDTEARMWAERYVAAHSGEVGYFFFGRSVIDEIVGTPGFERLDLRSAVGDDGAPKLVLMAWNDEGDPGFRSGSIDSTPYDSGMPCPPDCPAL